MINEQFLFLIDVAKLIIYANENGFTLTGGELFRTREQQEIYVKSGKSNTSNSNHLRRLAIDLHGFKNKVLLTSEEMKPLGDYWESLNPLNRWGGNFKNLKDGVHFERNLK
jgi:hypothetical protein